MIRLSDAVSLALAKFHQRKIRTIVTITVIVTACSLVLAAVTFFRGAYGSLVSFNSEGLNGRFLVSAMNYDYDQTLVDNEDVWRRAEEVYKEDISKKTALAKQIGIEYNPSFEVPPVEVIGGYKGLNMSSSAAQKALEEWHDKTSHKAGEKELAEKAQAYNPVNIYKTASRDPESGGFSVIQDGAEDFSGIATPSAGGEDPFLRGLAIVEKAIAEPFISAKDINPSSNIPIIITYQKAEKLLGWKELPGDASPEDKLQRMKDLQRSAVGSQVSVCYRNNASQNLVLEALSTDDDITKNQNKPEYAKPSLIHAPPQTPCGAVTVLEDSRTSDEKKEAERQLQFEKALGIYEGAAQAELPFVVIGLTPAPTYAQGITNLYDTLKSLTGSSLGDGVFVPENYLEQFSDQKLLSDIFTDENSYFFFPKASYLVEFSNAADASRFIREQSCVRKNTGCATAEKPFELTIYGNNSIVIDELMQMLIKAGSIVLLLICVLSVLLMSSSIGRLISDSRKETAVFRAIGFTRMDITKIYTTYAVMMAILICILSILLGNLIGFVVDCISSGTLTNEFRVIFQSIDESKAFHVYSPHIIDWIALAAAVVSVSYVSSLIPLLLSIRRNPINDLRAD